MMDGWVRTMNTGGKITYDKGQHVIEQYPDGECMVYMNYGECCIDTDICLECARKRVESGYYE